jgi:hypothetical protein
MIAEEVSFPINLEVIHRPFPLSCFLKCADFGSACELHCNGLSCAVPQVKHFG